MTRFSGRSDLTEWFSVLLVLIGSQLGMPLPLLRAGLAAALAVVIVASVVRALNRRRRSSALPTRGRSSALSP